MHSDKDASSRYAESRRAGTPRDAATYTQGYVHRPESIGECGARSSTRKAHMEDAVPAALEVAIRTLGTSEGGACAGSDTSVALCALAKTVTCECATTSQKINGGAGTCMSKLAGSASRDCHAQGRGAISPPKVEFCLFQVLHEEVSIHCYPMDMHKEQHLTSV